MSKANSEQTIIEYVCSRNVTRSPTYEAVTKWYAQQQGIDNIVTAISTGVDVDRLNHAELTEKEAEFYVKMAKDIEPALRAFHSLVEKSNSMLTEQLNNERFYRLAFGTMMSIDTLCVVMRDAALRERGIDPAYCGSQRQTASREDVGIIIATADKYVTRAQAFYPAKNKLILPLKQFGTEPVPFGFELKDFVAVVDTALENVPRIVEYALKKEIKINHSA